MLLSDCIGEELTWEAKYLRPYASMISDSDCGIGGPPIPVLEDSKPIEQFLTLKERMEVALLVSDDAGMRCVGIGVINECSPRGVWCGFLVPHSFFVVVIVTKEHRMPRSNYVLRRGIHDNPRRCDIAQGLMERVQSKADGASVPFSRF